MNADSHHLDERLTILSAADEQYARMMAQFLLSVRRHCEGVRCVVYDLGLTTKRRKWLKEKFSEVEFLDFEFHHYPAHVRDLRTYAWKAAIVNEWVQRRQRILWLDAGTLIRHADFLRKVADALDRQGIFALDSRSPLDLWCHPATFALMHARPEIRRERIVPSGIVGLDGGLKRIRKLATAWKRACNIRDIVAPVTSNRSNHRPDQAVLNNLLYGMRLDGELDWKAAGEIDISSPRPVQYVSTRNFTQNGIPLWCDFLIRIYRRSWKLTDQILWKLRDFHKSVLSGFHRLSHEKFEIEVQSEHFRLQPKSPWSEYWADPFMLKVDQLKWIFFEKYQAKTGKGVIAAIAVDNAGKIVRSARTVLDQPFHLSYPHLWKSGGRYYMIPESSAANTIDLYEAVDFPNCWQLRKRLLYGIDAADTTVLYAHKRFWLFCAVRVNPGMANRALHIYSARSLFAKEWTPHPINARNLYANLPHSGGRGAGRIFKLGKFFIRPMQWNTHYYGQGIKFMKITHLTKSHYSEVELNDAGLLKYSQSHHIDFQDGYAICDRRTRRSFGEVFFSRR